MQRPSHDFDAIYASETPPAWDIGRPQPAFDRLAKAGDLVGSVLDPGCGTGEHALLAAALDHGVVGVDLSAKAIELAMSQGNPAGHQGAILGSGCPWSRRPGRANRHGARLRPLPRSRRRRARALRRQSGGRGSSGWSLSHALFQRPASRVSGDHARVAQDEIRAAFSHGMGGPVHRPTIIPPRLGSRRRPRLAGGGQTHSRGWRDARSDAAHSSELGVGR